MRAKMMPFNIGILDPSAPAVKRLPAITATDIMAPSKTDMHPEGLYSTVIFGRQGEPERNTNEAKIDLKTHVFTPKLYEVITKLKQLYKGILEERQYAIWNPEIKDFEAASPLDGETGFYFFVKHLPEINLKRNSSRKRDLNIDLIEKYRDRLLMDTLIVLPAGLRDVDVSGDRPVETDISEMYRKILITTSTINPSLARKEDPLLDKARRNIQTRIQELYAHYLNMIGGKGGIIQKSWASRKVFGGTRNVITSMEITTPSLTDPRIPGINTTQIGLYQFMKSVVPLMRYHIRHGIAQHIMDNPNEVRCINTKTMKTETISLSQSIRDKWATDDGIERLINAFGKAQNRNKPVMINDHYFGLIYRDDDSYRVFFDMEELPEHLDRNKVNPLTWGELFYIAANPIQYRVGGFITRYPVTKLGSVYPTKFQLKTTFRSNALARMDESWAKTEDVLLEFPIVNDPSITYMETMALHYSKLDGLGADFDGDQVSCNIVWSDEAVKEIFDLLDSASTYITPDGNLLDTPFRDVNLWVMENFY